MNQTGTAPSTSTGSPEAWHRRPDPRLPAYLVAGFGALIVAIATGRQEFAALGAPFLALAALGLVNRDPAGLRGHVKLHENSAVEGDVVEGEVSVAWDGLAEVDVILAGWRGAPGPAMMARYRLAQSGD